MSKLVNILLTTIVISFGAFVVASAFESIIVMKVSLLCIILEMLLGALYVIWRP